MNKHKHLQATSNEKNWDKMFEDTKPAPIRSDFKVGDTLTKRGEVPKRFKIIGETAQLYICRYKDLYNECFKKTAYGIDFRK